MLLNELKTKKIPFIAYVVKMKNKYFEHLTTVKHIPPKIFRHIHFFIKSESESVHKHFVSLVYQQSLIKVSSLEVPFRIIFSRPCESTMSLLIIFFELCIAEHILEKRRKTKEKEEKKGNNGSDDGTKILKRTAGNVKEEKDFIIVIG